MTVAEIIKKAMLAGLGAQEKAKEFVDELVKAGELSKSDASSLVKEWVSKAEDGRKEFDHKIKDAVSATFEKLNIPSRDDIEKMEKKLQNISARLAKLENTEEKGAA
ncbi:MAG TPA: phasin family protein [Nitrospirota bacterium]|jgi:polyhydroxyalkanoate synthesis regulator phasin|nr:phasin family protein [Nitrospirota bacterium]